MRRAFKAALIYLAFSIPIILVQVFAIPLLFAGTYGIIFGGIPRDPLFSLFILFLFLGYTVAALFVAAILFKLLSEVIADEVEERVRKRAQKGQ
jgi:hypothetical protein